MARKYDFISELYNRTCKTVVANPASWEAFLRSACYNYRLRFDEQLLVHAQRPDATAVLQIDDWNQKFGRWVNRGAHGIAVFEDADQRRQRLVHYFDISDTHPSRFSRRVPIWQMRDEYTAEVIDTLESTFGELNDKETLAVAIESAARNAVEDNIPDYLTDLLYSVKDSFLDGVSEEEITHIFKTAVRNSVAYMTMTRLGIEAGEYFEPDDLRDVVNFTTPATLNALGYATSDIAEMGLAEISRTILALDRQNRIIAEKTKADYNVGKEKTERSPDDERDHLHEAGGLSAPRSDNAGTAGAVDGQVRPDAEEVPEGASQGTLLQPADELRPERASERHGAQSERDGTDADGADGGVGGRDGEPESDGYDELGSEDEQHPEPSAGDRDDGGNLRLDYYDRSHEDKSLPFFGGDDTVREILGTTPHLKASKDEIRAFFEATADEDARISYIKRIFNNDYTEVILSDGRRVGYKTYQNVLQLWEDSYLSRTAQSFYDWGVIAQHFEAMRLLGELQDTMKPLPSIDGQLSLMTAGAEERKPSAFTFSQEIIDAVLTRGSGISEGKMRIYEQFQKSLSAKENADFLKNEYGWGGVYPAIVGADIDEQHDGKGIRISKGIGNDKPHIDLKWSQVEKRIADLIKLDRYLNPKEKAQYPAWLQRQEERRAALAEERRNREILSTAPSEKAEAKNEQYEYHLGSTVYLGANEYESLAFNHYTGTTGTDQISGEVPYGKTYDFAATDSKSLAGGSISYEIETDEEDIASINAETGLLTVNYPGTITVIFQKVATHQNNVVATQLDAIVEYVKIYCENEGIQRLPNICLAPLEDIIDYTNYGRATSGAFAVPIGIYDDPGHQAQEVAILNISAGNTVIIGSAQYGKTNLLQLIIRSLSENYSPRELNIYILDFGSMALRSFEGLHHVGGVVVSSEDERVKNLFRLLSKEITVRKEKLAHLGITSFNSYVEAGFDDMPYIVFMIDNFIAFKELYPDYEDDMLRLCREGISLGISVLVTSLQTNGISYKYMSNFSNRICLYCNSNDEYSTLFDRCRIEPKAVPGRGLIQIEKQIFEAQTYLAFAGEREIDRVKAIQSYVNANNSKHPDEFAKAIPSIPKLLDKMYVIRNAPERKPYQMVVGLDYNFVEFQFLDLSRVVTVGIAGRERSGKTNLTKLVFDYCLSTVFDYPTKAYIIDDYGQQLKQFSSYGFVERYTVDPTALDVIFPEIEEELKHRKTMLQENGSEFLEQEPLIVCAIENQAIFENGTLSKQTIEVFKRIITSYKQLKVLFIFTNIPYIQRNGSCCRFI